MTPTLVSLRAAPQRDSSTQAQRIISGHFTLSGITVRIGTAIRGTDALFYLSTPSSACQANLTDTAVQIAHAAIFTNAGPFVKGAPVKDAGTIGPSPTVRILPTLRGTERVRMVPTSRSRVSRKVPNRLLAQDPTICASDVSRASEQLAQNRRGVLAGPNHAGLWILLSPDARARQPKGS